MKIGFISLGCPKNQLDTEVMLHEVVAAGFSNLFRQSKAPCDSDDLRHALRKDL